ncbi:MAG: hypothetical protein EBU90_12085 [Proteobacteria bacterium]|nr:hypothetical protein [Pseudomonadota bacterium]NBP14812.1 hypothetical protein [bacterium]
MIENSIKITFDLEQRQYAIEQSEIFDKKITLMFSFKSSDEIVKFNNLSFGILVQNENKDIIFIKSWPLPNTKYISTDQEFLEIFSLNLETGKSYNLLLWNEETNIRTDKNISITIPEIEEMPDYEVE